MIFYTIFTFFLALVSASVISKGPDRSPFAQLSTREPINDCDFGYYEDHTDDKSPFISDCEILVTRLRDATYYIILNGEYKQIAEYKSCAVGIVSADCENSHSLVMSFSLLSPLCAALCKVHWLTRNDFFSELLRQPVLGQDRKRGHRRRGPELNRNCQEGWQSGRGQGGSHWRVQLPA
jgi:hypothetical protein